MGGAETLPSLVSSGSGNGQSNTLRVIPLAHASRKTAYVPHFSDGRTAPVVRRGRMGVMLTSSVQHREDRGKHARIVRVRVYGGNVPDG